MSSLERFAAFDQNAVDGADTSAHHDSGGRGQTESARTRNAQHRDGVLERPLNHQLVKTPSTLRRQRHSLHFHTTC